jgi:hypothetical protein
MDDKAWPVAFHGVGYPKALIVSNIAIHGLKIVQSSDGGRHLYADKKCIRTGKIIGEGIYCSPKIEVAEYFADSNGESFLSTDGKRHKIVFQCRVNPYAIRECPTGKSDDIYWVINDPKDIRPYGICMREV